ncbi:MAG: ABC transporter permease, partial [Cryomorphaceae bacterium]
MNKTGLIIHREYFSRVKKKSFIVMTLLGPVLIAGLMGLGIYLGMSDDTRYNVLVADLTPGISSDSISSGNPLFFNKLRSTDQIRFSYTDQGLSNAEFDSSEYSLMVVIREDILTVPQIEMVFRKLPSMKARSYIASQIEKVIEREKLNMYSIDKRTYDSIRTDVDVISVNASDGETSYKQEQAVVGFAFAVLIYFFIFLYGVQVMRGVMEEKSNRIVEVIISSVRPFQLMMGKIVGVALVGLTQFLLWVVLTFTLFTLFSSALMPEMAGAGSAAEMVQATESAAAQASEDEANQALLTDFAELILFRINWPVMLLMFVFYFLGGYLLYASLFAAVGAAVDNETDTQQFMLPITIPLIFAFLVAEFALANPEGSAVFWFSVVPFTSPVVMMVRVAMGFDGDTLWQLILSMALLVAGFLAAVWLAAKIYRVGILM